MQKVFKVVFKDGEPPEIQSLDGKPVDLSPKEKVELAASLKGKRGRKKKVEEDKSDYGSNYGSRNHGSNITHVSKSELRKTMLG